MLALLGRGGRALYTRALVGSLAITIAIHVAAYMLNAVLPFHATALGATGSQVGLLFSVTAGVAGGSSPVTISATPIPRPTATAPPANHIHHGVERGGSFGRPNCEIDEIPVCTSYKLCSRETMEMPASNHAVEALEPVYTMLPGWKTQTAGIKRYGDLPARAKDYLAFLAEHTGVEVGCISTGPERSETIIVPGSKLERALTAR